MARWRSGYSAGPAMRSTGRRFLPRPPRFGASTLGKSFTCTRHSTCASVTKQYNLVPGQTGKVWGHVGRAAQTLVAFSAFGLTATETEMNTSPPNAHRHSSRETRPQCLKR